MSHFFNITQSQSNQVNKHFKADAKTDSAKMETGFFHTILPASSLAAPITLIRQRQ